VHACNAGSPRSKSTRDGRASENLHPSSIGANSLLYWKDAQLLRNRYHFPAEPRRLFLHGGWRAGSQARFRTRKAHRKQSLGNSDHEKVAIKRKGIKPL